MATIYDDIATLKEQVATLQTDVGGLKTNVSTLQSQVKTLQTNVAALQDKHKDSGWINLPLASGIAAYSDELRPKYRKIGNRVFLRGVVKGITAANAILATLPTGFRPGYQHYFVAGSSNVDSKATFFNCQVNTDGNIRITTHSAATYNASYYLRLDSSFLID